MRKDNDPLDVIFAGVEIQGLAEFGDAPEWSVKPNILNSADRPIKNYTLSRGLVNLDVFISPNAILFGWNGDVRDVFKPGNLQNYVDFMDLVLQQLPMRIDTQLRNLDELKASFEPHSKVEFEFDDGRVARYALGVPAESWQFGTDFVNEGDRVASMHVIGRDRSETGDYRYVLSLTDFDTQNPRMGLALPIQRKEWGEELVSLPDVLEWVLTTNEQRRLIPNPRYDGLLVGGLVYDLIAQGNPPDTA